MGSLGRRSKLEFDPVAILIGVDIDPTQLPMIEALA